MSNRRVSVALLCVASFACVSAAYGDGTAYELASYSNGPGGKQLAMGDYAAAIEQAARASARDPLTSLIAATNMCVAQTASRAFAAARASCDRALELARTEDGASHRGVRRGTLATSRALSNRGVLRALSGDPTGAARDLRAAALGAAEWTGALQNCAVLEKSPSYRVALAEDIAE